MADNCNDYFEQLKKLQEDNDRLRKDLDQSERARKAGEAFLRTEAKKQWVIPMQDGSMRSIDDASIERAYGDFVARMMSDELQQTVDRGLGKKARPIGSEGRFTNFRMLLENANAEDAEAFAKLIEATTATWKDLAPEDFAFTTSVYGREKAMAMAADVLRAYGNDDEVAAFMANNSAAFMQVPERMVRSGFMADLAKSNYLDSVREMSRYMKQTADRDNAGDFGTIKRRLFSNYRKMLGLQRNYSVAGRAVGQALRARQFDFSSGVKMGIDTDELGAILARTAKDVRQDEHIAQVMKAIDANDVDMVDQLVITGVLDDDSILSPMANGWENHHMRFGNALVKESQLGTFGTLIRANLLGTFLKNTHGYLYQTFHNIGTLTPFGTRFSREAYGEGLRIAWESARFSHDMVRRAARELTLDAFNEGLAPFGGAVDTFGRKGANNDMLLAQTRDVFNRPFSSNPLDAFGQTVHKIHAAYGLLKYHATGKLPQMITPAFRAMNATDQVLGYDAFAFKLKNDLEIKARRDGAQLGLLDQKSRDEWVQKQLDDAFYHVAPTEQDVISFRQQHKLKQSDLSDSDIRKIITSDRAKATYGYPTMATPEAEGAMEYSLRNRMQMPPEGGLAGAVDAGVMKWREHWALESLNPYWRAPFNSYMLDFSLAMPPVREFITVLHHGLRPEKVPVEKVAKAQATLVISGTLVSLFAGLEMLGLIEGNGPLQPEARRAWLLEGNKPNSLFGVPYLGGLPILGTLFLWKDLKETFWTGNYSNYDQYGAHYGILQVLGSQLIRQTGFGQLQRLIDVLTNPTEAGWGRFLGWMAQGALPASGPLRDLQRATGHSGVDFYQDQLPGKGEAFMLGDDDPFAEKLRVLRNMAHGVVPMLGAATGAPRKEQDFLGQPIQLEFGADWAEAMKSRFHPRMWPRANQRVYAELDAQGRLTLPGPLLARQLEGVSMSSELQKEYNDTFGAVKGNIPLEARMALAGRKVSVSFPMQLETPIDMRKQFAGAGVVVAKSGGSAAIDLGPFLSKHVKGRTIVEAFTSLFNDPVYKRMQDLPGTTSDLEVRDMPPARRRAQAASQMIQGVYDYYQLLTQDQLEASSTPAAQDWRERRAAIAREAFTEQTDKLRDLMESLGQPVPAQR